MIVNDNLDGSFSRSSVSGRGVDDRMGLCTIEITQLRPWTIGSKSEEETRASR